MEEKRPEHMCIKCNRNTAGTSRIRLRRKGVFIASMHSTCAFDLRWTADTTAEEPATEAKLVALREAASYAVAHHNLDPEGTLERLNAALGNKEDGQ